jgi:hypothetical protein
MNCILFPIAYKSGKDLSKAYLFPDAIIVKAAFYAPFLPPLIGQSKKCTFLYNNNCEIS